MISVLDETRIEAAILEPSKVKLEWLNSRLQKELEPRLSQSQREELVAVARADPHARIEGLDGRHRLVVFAKLGGPNGPTRYALLKNGASTTVVGPQLAEEWK